MSTSVNVDNPSAENQAVYQKPIMLKKLLAWGAFLWGILCILTGVFGEESFAGSIAMLLVGFAFFIPGAWWMYCESEDEKAFRQYQETLQTNENLARFLTDADHLVLQGMSGVHPPRKKDRKWPLVTVGSIIAFIAGALVMPVEGQAGQSGAATSTAASTTTPPPLSTSSSATPTTSSATPTTTATTTVDPVAEESAARAAEKARRAEQARIEEERAAAEAEQEVVEEPVQQQFVAPAQAPQPAAANYANCTAVWNAVGGPIYAGDAGYGSHLDRDGDGVGCENDPR